MKKPNPIPLIDQMAFEQWQEQRALEDLSDDDKAGNDAIEQFKAAAKKGRAKKVAEVIRGLGLTDRQVEIFQSFVDTGNFRETARELKIDESRVRQVVEMVRAKTIKGMTPSARSHK